MSSSVKLTPLRCVETSEVDCLVTRRYTQDERIRVQKVYYNLKLLKALKHLECRQPLGFRDPAGGLNMYCLYARRQRPLLVSTAVVDHSLYCASGQL
jgi:hypothetical protein